MSKKVQKFLKRNKLDYTEFRYAFPAYKVNDNKKYLYSIFGLFFGLYLLSAFSIIPINISGLLVYVMFSLFVLYPIATRKDNPNELLLILKDRILKAEGRKDYVEFEYNSITKFKQDELAMYLVGGRELITLPNNLYDSEFEILIDILEALGKTFDKEKEFMIRDIEISFSNNNVVITEIEQEETETERITKRLFNKYNHLTPGFIEDIIPRNTIIRDIQIKKEHLHISCEPIEVKVDHPENITFENQTAYDAVFIFENAVIVKFEARDSNKKLAPYEEVKPSVKAFNDLLKDAIIDEWKYMDNEVIFIFKSGLGNVRLQIKYTEVIIGWNKVK